jgi:D-beta-D-heptose 7-phosphate kinase / D-beta-D-heptose 1-phosphate adenosyltransferase
MKPTHKINFNKEILILGDIFLDVFQNTNTLKISPERPVPVLKPSNVVNLLGGAANVANNIKSIGGSPFLISKLCDDITCKTIKKLLVSNKINFKIVTNINYSSPVKKRIVQNDHQFCRLDDENHSKLNKKDEIKIIKFINKNIYKFQSLIISDYSKGFLTPSLISKTIKIFKNNKKKIFTDPKNKNISMYEGSNYICPNQNELSNFFDYEKLKINTKNTVKLVKKAKSDALIVTKGSHGISILSKDKKIINISQQTVNVYDVTGAGDTFIAFFSFLTSNKIDVINSIKISSCACVKIVQKKHTAILNFKEFQEIISKFCFENDIDLNLKVKLWKLANFKIGITNGCFDVIHSGHLHLFSNAKKLCDKLIVLINSDKSVKDLKGDMRPKIKLEKRIELIKLVTVIDDIIPFDEKTPINLIEKIIPNILFKGSDYKKKEVIGYDFIKRNGGVVKIINQLSDFSTTKLIK